jgi:hypothetical protein
MAAEETRQPAASPGATKSRCRGDGPRPRAPFVTSRPRTADGDATRVVPYDAEEEEERTSATSSTTSYAEEAGLRRVDVGLTRDKFLQKLRDNKASLVAKHKLPDGSLQRVREGRQAALKATPIRE